jgi:hypothetical protein
MVEALNAVRRRLPRFVYWAIGILVGGYLALTLFGWLFAPYGPPSIIESHGKLNLADAKKQFDLPYPDSAHDIQFASYAQWIAIEDFVRFEAPLDDCIDFAQKTIARHNAANPDRPAAELHPITDVSNCAELASSKELTTDWFDLCSIRNGLAGGSLDSHIPQLWIDTDRGVVYFKYSD